MTPEDSQTVAAWIGAVSTVATALVAVVAIFFARGQLREASEARKLTKELDVSRSQPYVVLYLEESLAGPGFVDVVLRNYGQTAAFDVTVSIEPEMQRSWDGDAAPEKVDFPDVWPVLAPGQEWRTFFDSGNRRESSGLPDEHRAVVEYFGIARERLQTSSLLDWNVYRNRLGLVVKSTHNVAESLEKIAGSLDGFTEDRIRGGLSVFTRSGDEKDRMIRQQREANIDEARRQNALDGPTDPSRRARGQESG